MRAWRTLTLAMWRSFIRDRTSLFFYFLLPLMFLVMFGLVLGDGGGASRITIGVVGDGDVIDALPDEVVDVERFEDFDDAVEAVRVGDVPAALRQRGDLVELRYSATDQVAAGATRSVLDSIIGQANLAAAAAPAVYSLDAAQVEDDSFEPIQYMTSGILAWGVAMSAAFGASLTLVNWRRNQVLRRLRLSPAPTATVVGARIGISLAVATLQAAVFIGVALTPPFGLQLHGSWWLAIPLLYAGTLAFMSIGLLVGSLVKTEEAASAIVNLIVLPMAFLSGVFFDFDALPSWLQQLSITFPLRHMNDGMVDVLVRGEGVTAVIGPVLVLLGFAAVVSAIATRFFAWDD